MSCREAALRRREERKRKREKEEKAVADKAEADKAAAKKAAAEKEGEGEAAVKEDPSAQPLGEKSEVVKEEAGLSERKVAGSKGDATVTAAADPPAGQAPNGSDVSVSALHHYPQLTH